MLTAIAQHEIGPLWEWVRQGLLQIKAKATPESCPWLPEDVYLKLMTGGAALYVIGAEQGFCVLQRAECSYERVLFVWALWTPPRELWHERQAVMDALDDLARQLGLTKIRMFTTRESGWLATKLFAPVSAILEREVSNGWS
jgi:hypothetical protein